MNIVEQFFKEEEAKLSWLERKFNYFPEYYFVKDINAVLPHYSYTKGDYIIRSSIFLRLIYFLFFCFSLFFWSVFLLLVLSKTLLPISIIFFLVVTYGVSFIFWEFFISPKYPHKIIFTIDRLVIGKKMIEWNRITEYLIIEKWEGGKNLRKVPTLVLFIDNKEIVRKSLRNLNISGKEVLKLIELYKQKNDRITSYIRHSRLSPGYDRM